MLENAQPILVVDKINLVFRTKLYRNENLRDAFISAIKSPISSLLNVSDRHLVLKNISFTVYPGDRIGLIGVNGAGKTSLCRCISNVYAPGKGKIQLNGKIRPIFDTAIGMYPELSGRENANLLIKFLYHDLSAKEQKDVLADVIQFSELKDFIDAPYRTYSNGMQARLGLSLISARPTDLLILDEVFDGADQFFREKISKRINKLITSSGAVIFVSHSKPQVLEVCNRVLFLHQGEIIFDGSPAEGLELYEKMGASN